MCVGELLLKTNPDTFHTFKIKEQEVFFIISLSGIYLLSTSISIL